ncbi:MAG: FAD-binding oxidoreductase [Sphingomonadales bacterium]|nr:FAD-binding oxidoreductase [Sphingomonadales bacterium]
MSVLDQLKAIVGRKGWSEDADEIAPHLIEWRGLYRGQTPLLLKPASTAEVAAILKICQDNGARIAVQGGNTGVVCGGVPDDGGEEILLTLSRLHAIRAVDAANFTLTAEAGVTVTALQEAAKAHDRLFPLSLASEGSCTLGGVIATNAGGVNVLRYGVMRDLVLGIEAVLPTGEIVELLSGLRKDNTGYDVKQLFIGAEGTLGIVTAATVKLFPAPKVMATAFVAVPNPQAALDLLALARAETGDRLTAFELICRAGVELVIKHIPGARDPLTERAPWYVLLEVTTSNAEEALEPRLEALAATAAERGLLGDGTVAQTEAQRQSLWKLRENMSEAQKIDSASIKHDISLPLSAIPDFLTRASDAVLAAIPGARPMPFGHLGDGNLHFNISAPIGMERRAFEARWSELNRIVHDIVVDMGGSISAEHGIGRLKKADLAHYKDATALSVMRALKRTLDPKNILNRGRIFDV